jgi:glucose-1-phosphate cytidylyltransferase
MEAMILCGGLGTRLREETEYKPKPMVQVGQRPILWHIMRRYSMFGVRRFILCLGYKGEVIRDYFLHYRQNLCDATLRMRDDVLEVHSPQEVEDWEIVFANTGDTALTGARVLRALKYVQGDTFHLTYGDGLADVDLRAVEQLHAASGGGATVTAVHPSSRFGEIDVQQGRVTSFLEKPQVAAGWINGGFFVFDKAVLKDIEPRDDLALESGVLPLLAEQGRMNAYQHNGFWQCMDTFREMQMLNELWSSGRAPWAPRK